MFKLRENEVILSLYTDDALYRQGEHFLKVSALMD